MSSQPLIDSVNKAIEMFGDTQKLLKKNEKLLKEVGGIAKLAKDVKAIKTNHLKHIEKRLKSLEGRFKKFEKNQHKIMVLLRKSR